MTISQDLRDAFRFHRQNGAFRAYGDNRPTLSIMLQKAREDVKASTKRYPHSARHAALGDAFAGYGTKAMRWVESPADVGLRFVGYADKLARIDHTGWFSDPFQSETVRGVVYMLPSQHGTPIYVSGYDDARNGAADNGGPAAVDFGTIWEDVPLGFSSRRYSDYYKGEHRAAAYHADKLAERAAEEERDYQTANSLGFSYGQTLEELADLRKSVLATFADMRGNCATLKALPETIRRRIGESLKRDLATRSKLHVRLAQLLTGSDGGELGFWTGDKRLAEAFNEGAGRNVLPV